MPSFKTIAEFRSRHLNALAELFAQVLFVHDQSRLISLKHVSFDGTKTKVNASKHEAMNYGRMRTTRAKFDKEIEELLQENVRLDEEDRRFGPDKRGDELPEDLCYTREATGQDQRSYGNSGRSAW